MDILRTENLVKTFIDGRKETRVLKGMNLSIENGSFVAITGKSGSGKSTLVYQLGLLDEPTSGEVYINDKESSKLSVDERTKYRLNNFGFVFQDYALMPELLAWENVALPMLMRGFSKSDSKNKAEATLDLLGMKERSLHRPSQLSGGESQRVSIARAIIHNPAVLFADEPTANLDSERSRQIIDIFHDLHKKGQTIVMVSHEVEYVQESPRIITIEDGVIINDESK